MINTMSYYRYQHCGNRVICLKVQLRYDSVTPRWWKDRITEVRIPPNAECVADIEASRTDSPVGQGYRATQLYNDRTALMLVDVETTVNPGEWQPVLQLASQAPTLTPCLHIDSDGALIAERDHARWLAGAEDSCDNPWVPGLFPDALDEELRENEEGRR